MRGATEMGASPLSAGTIQLLLSLVGHVTSAAGSDGGAAPIDKSFVLEYRVVEELASDTLVGVVPRDYQLNRKYLAFLGSPAARERRASSPNVA